MNTILFMMHLSQVFLTLYYTPTFHTTSLYMGIVFNTQIRYYSMLGFPPVHVKVWSPVKSDCPCLIIQRAVYWICLHYTRNFSLDH